MSANEPAVERGDIVSANVHGYVSHITDDELVVVAEPGTGATIATVPISTLVEIARAYPFGAEVTPGKDVEPKLETVLLRHRPAGHPEIVIRVPAGWKHFSDAPAVQWECLAPDPWRAIALLERGTSHYYNPLGHLVLGCGTSGCEECRRGGVSS